MFINILLYEVLIMNDEKVLSSTAGEIGRKIQKYRTAQGLTQEFLAERTGISQKHLSRIEQGYHDPRFELIIKISDVLGIPTDALAKDSDADDTALFLAALTPYIEKMSAKQREYIKECIRLMAELDV